MLPGKQIKARREALGYTQVQVANALGIYPTTVSMWEREETSPRPEQLDRIAKVLQCTVADLFKEKNT